MPGANGIGTTAMGKTKFSGIYNLDTNDFSHTNRLEEGSIENWYYDLLVDELDHANRLENGEVTETLFIVPKSLIHEHAIGFRPGTSRHSGIGKSSIGKDGGSIQPKSDPPTIKQYHDLSVAELNHENRLDQASVTETFLFSPNDLRHKNIYSGYEHGTAAHSAIGKAGIGRDGGVAPSTVPGVPIKQYHDLSVSELQHNNRLEQSTVTEIFLFSPDDLRHENRFLRIEYGNAGHEALGKIGIGLSGGSMGGYVEGGATITVVYNMSPAELQHKNYLDQLGIANSIIHESSLILLTRHRNKTKLEPNDNETNVLTRLLNLQSMTSRSENRSVVFNNEQRN